MAVISLGIFRRVRGHKPPRIAVKVATLTPGACARLAVEAERQLVLDRARYDARAKQLRDFGVDPAEVLGVRP